MNRCDDRLRDKRPSFCSIEGPSLAGFEDRRPGRFRRYASRSAHDGRAITDGLAVRWSTIKASTSNLVPVPWLIASNALRSVDRATG
jgi:hypothetical protein